MLCTTCGQEIMPGAAFCPYCGEKVVRQEREPEPETNEPVYRAIVKRMLKSGELLVYRDRTEFVTSSVQKAIFDYANLAAIKKEWDHIDFITEDGYKESCPADRKCVHEAFLYIEQMARPYLTRRKDLLLSQGVRYSFPSSQGMLNDGVLNISADQAEFRGKSGKSEVVSFRDVKAVSAFGGTLDLQLFDRRTKSFAVSKELRDEVAAFVADSIAPYLARRKEELLARGIYFSFCDPDGAAVDFFADRVQRSDRYGQTEVVFFQDVRTAGVFEGKLELAETDGTSRSFSIDWDAENEVLSFVRDAIEPYVKARTEGFDTAFGLDERLEINQERGVFHIIRQGGKEITGEWPLEALTQCRWEERTELNALGSMVSGGIALLKRAAGGQTVSDTEERLSCAGIVVTLQAEGEEQEESVWFGLFPTGMSRSNKKYDQYLAEWTALSEYLAAHCPTCEQVEPVFPEPAPEAEIQIPEAENSAPEISREAGPDSDCAEIAVVPDTAAGQDDLGIARYIGGIAGFIDDCKTPMTIAFQGNRGREENSVLRILFNRLGEHRWNHRLWLSAGQFSQGESGEALSILVGRKLVGLFSEGDSSSEKSGVFITNLAGLFTAKMVGDSSIGKEMVGGLLNKPSTNSLEQLVELFGRKAGELAGTGKVVVFVDGLERLAPVRAAEILEAMRAFFTCKGCVFVIAAEYNAVVSGIRQLHGEDYSESRARAFFDELFKMSFRVPASSYNMGNYVRSKLDRFGIPAADEDELDLYVSLIHNSLGRDLESIERLFTSFQLIKTMADEEVYKSRYNRLVLFALLCMQAGFRRVYDRVIARKDSVTPEFLAGLCGRTAQPWGVELVSDEKKAAFQDFADVFARIINLDEDMHISEPECQAFVKVLEFSSITSK